MSARSKARKRAVDLLFEAEQRGLNARDLLTERLAKPVTEAPLNQYTADLVEGVVAHWTDINELLTTYSQGWSLERIRARPRRRRPSPCRRGWRRCSGTCPRW